MKVKKQRKNLQLPKSIQPCLNTWQTPNWRRSWVKKKETRRKMTKKQLKKLRKKTMITRRRRRRLKRKKKQRRKPRKRRKKKLKRHAPSQKNLKKRRTSTKKFFLTLFLRLWCMLIQVVLVLLPTEVQPKSHNHLCLRPNQLHLIVPHRLHLLVPHRRLRHLRRSKASDRLLFVTQNCFLTF